MILIPTKNPQDWDQIYIIIYIYDYIYNYIYIYITIYIIIYVRIYIYIHTFYTFLYHAFVCLFVCLFVSLYVCLSFFEVEGPVQWFGFPMLFFFLVWVRINVWYGLASKVCKGKSDEKTHGSLVAQH